MELKFWIIGLAAAGLACGTTAVDESAGSDTPTEQEDQSVDGARADGGTRPTRDGSSRPAQPDPSGDDDDSNEDFAGDDDRSNICDSVDIEARPNAPQILIVLDRSGSMLGLNPQGGGGPNRWEPSASAVKKVTAELEQVVNFGLMLFPSPGGAATSGGDAGVSGVTIPGLGTIPIPGLPPGTTIPGLGGDPCATGKVDVPVDALNAMKIAGAIDVGMPIPGNATPTTASLQAAASALESEPCADCRSSRKYVLLVTDGQPTCGQGGTGMTTPGDIEATNGAIDRLREADVLTYVVGYGTKSDPTLARTMDGFAEHGGTEQHLAVENEAELVDELRTIAGTLVSCEYELNEDIEDPALVRVSIDGTTLVLGEGWKIDGRKIVLEEGPGGACLKLKDGRVHSVKIRKECEPMIFQ